MHLVAMMMTVILIMICLFCWFSLSLTACGWYIDGDGMSLGHRAHQSTVNQLRTLAECDARAMESAARAMQEVMVKRIEEASSRVAAAAAAAAAANSQAKLTTTTSAPMKVEDVTASTKRSRSTAAEDQVQSNSNSSSGGNSGFVQPPQPGPAPPQPPPPAHLLLAGRSTGVGAAHIKLTSRSECIYCVFTLKCVGLSSNSSVVGDDDVVQLRK